METMTDFNAMVRNANQKFEAEFAQGNAAGIANLYTEDGVVLPTGMDIIKGKQGIQEFWQGAMDMGIKKAKLETLEVQQCEDTAIEMGKYKLSGEDGKEIDHGKYIVIWSMQNGQPKLHKDIWNSSISNG